MNEEYFRGPGIYINLIMDLIDEYYFRCYGGQASETFERIKYHMGKIRKGDRSTLHYFIRSQPNRYNKFIRLTEVGPSTSRDGFEDFMLTMCEAVQCLALQLLPEATLKEFLPPDIEIVFHTSQLNVASPLLQGLMSPSLRRSEFTKLQYSTDSEVRAYYEFRTAQKKTLAQQIKTKSIAEYKPTPRSPEEYGPVFSTAIQDQAPEISNIDRLLEPLGHAPVHDVDQSYLPTFGKIQSEFVLNYPDLPTLIAPKGSLDSSVAVILYEPSPRSRGGQSTEVLKDEMWPSTMEEKGLNSANAMMWYLFPQRMLRKPAVEDGKLVISATDESLQAMTLYLEFSKMMLNSCTAKHIILCGKTVQGWINSEYNASLKRLKLKMGMCELPIQLQLEDNLVRRVFFPTVDPCKILFKGDLASVQKLDNTVNIAAWLRSIPGVPTRHFELKGFLTLPATEVRKQREGDDIVTMDTLHPWLKTWLRREGFVADDGTLLESDSPGQTLLDTIQVLISEKGAMNSARNRQYRFAKRI